MFAQGSTEDKANVTSDNFPLVLGKEADNEEIDTELMTLIATFFRVQPAERSDLTIHDLFVSSDYRIEDIRRRLLYLANRDWINGVRTDVFRITSKGFEEAESRARGGDTTDVHANKYFQLVSLPRGIKKPFVFVLMPFKDQEGFKQEVYRKVIKPTVEQELGVICVRSDEVPDPGVINNQIFTLIRDAECIIAETTTGNPNVFYEVGMAHAFNKDVFIFNRSKNKLPFDIRGDRAVFYDDYEDLKRKLVDNLKDHV